jgi:hypothetical protein
LDLAEWNGLEFMIYSVNDDKNSWNRWAGQLRNYFTGMVCDVAEDTQDSVKQQMGEYVWQKAFHRSLLLYKGSNEMMHNQEISPYDDPSGLVKIDALPVPGVRPVFFLAASSTFSCSMFLT